MKKIIMFLIPAMALLGGCKKKEVKPSESEPEVSVGIAACDSVVLHRTYPGYIYAEEKADVVGLVNGKLLSQNYTEGSYVRKGQVLFTIDSSTYRDAVARAQAEVNSATSQLEYASKNYEAMKMAFKSDAVSEMEVVQALNSKNSAQAALASARASLNTAKTNLSHCTVVAPISGHISASILSPGNYVAGEGSPVVLASIYNDSEMKVKFDIEDSRFLSMNIGGGRDAGKLYSSIPLIFDEPTEQPYSADLYYTSPSVDSSTGTVTLEGHVKNDKKELKDGMYVKIDLPYGVDPKAVVINDASIGTNQAGSYVYLVNDSNRVVMTPVEVGELYQDTLRIIKKGLKPGDRYVNKALLKVRAGQKVKIANK